MTTRRPLLTFVANVAAAVAIVWLGAVAVFVAPTFEEAWFPVLTDQVPTVTRSGNIVTFTVIVHKRRACAIDTITWQLVGSDEFKARTPITVRTVATQAEVDNRVVYPKGVFRNGPFEAMIPLFFSGADYIVGQIEYRCRPWPFWTTPQVYGPFPIPKPTTTP